MRPFYERVERKDAPMIALRLPADLYEAVLAEARREGLPTVEVVRGVLRAWAAGQEPHGKESAESLAAAATHPHGDPPTVAGEFNKEKPAQTAGKASCRFGMF